VHAILNLIDQGNSCEAKLPRRRFAGRSAKSYKLVTFHSLLIPKTGAMHETSSGSIEKMMDYTIPVARRSC
jgi:hypothetical protein